jgi:poly(A) polymerase
MSENIGVQPWMKLPATEAVIAALEAGGGPGCARFVGGCVRNTLLKAEVADIDIATTLAPGEVVAALKAAGIRSVPTGLDHGTVTAISGSKPYEITTLRRDVSTDGRRAVVAFTDDWSEDAQRRDFRLNALYADAKGNVFDPTGGGLDDARAGRIVFVGDAQTRIREDYLRILRFFRFLAWYGRGEPDREALAACEALKDGMEQLSAERVSKELLKLLAADDPRPALRLMAATGVLTQVLPAAGSLARFEALVAIETEQLFENDPELRLAALLPNDLDAARQSAERLRLSNAARERLVAALGTEHRLVSYLSPKEARQRVYQLGQRTFADRVKLAWAGAQKGSSSPQWRGLLALGQTWTAPTLPLTGEEIMAAGVPKGPLVGEVMREVEAWWIDNDFIDDKLSVVERLKAVAQGLAY